MTDDFSGILRVFYQHRDNLIDRDRIVMGMPAVIVGDHGHGYVANLGFAGELRFLEIGHPDYVHAPAAVNIRLGFGGKLRPLHAQVRAPELLIYSCLATGGMHDFREFGADGVGKRDVRDNAVAEKSVDAMTSAIEKLVGENEVEGLMFLF